VLLPLDGDPKVVALLIWRSQRGIQTNLAAGQRPLFALCDPMVAARRIWQPSGGSRSAMAASMPNKHHGCRFYHRGATTFFFFFFPIF
jgi:hypothetical protein